MYYSTQYSLLEWISAVNDNPAPELVHSLSYGNDEHQQVSVDYMDAVNIEFMKAGCRGISLFIASGKSQASKQAGTFHSSLTHPSFSPIPPKNPFHNPIHST